MSPLWRDEVGVFVAPGGVLLTRMARGLRPRVVAKEYIQVDGGSAINWEPSMNALRLQLQQDRWHAANARVVVSNLWMRYAMVPWEAELRGANERQAHARMVLAQTYGETEEAWHVTLSESLPGRPQLAAAAPAALVGDLQELAAGARLRVLTLQPQLVVAFNSWRRALPKGGGWFVSLDSGSLAAAHFGEEGWDTVRSVRIGQDWAAELHRLKRFGRLAAGQSGQSQVYVDAPLWVRKLASTQADGLEMLDRDDQLSACTLRNLISLRAVHP